MHNLKKGLFVKIKPQVKSDFDFCVQTNLSISTCFLRLLEHNTVHRTTVFLFEFSGISCNRSVYWKLICFCLSDRIAWLLTFSKNIGSKAHSWIYISLLGGKIKHIHGANRLLWHEMHFKQKGNWYFHQFLSTSKQQSRWSEKMQAKKNFTATEW